MNENQLKEYAKLCAKIGANVQKGQRVVVFAEVDQLPFVRAITEECYALGAEYVEIIWSSSDITRLHFGHASEEVLGEVRPWQEERMREAVRDLPVSISIMSESPDALSGISPQLIANVSRRQSAVMKKYRDQMEGKAQWLIVAASSPDWAHSVFPDEPVERAMDKLWDAIFKCVYMDERDDAGGTHDPVQIWQAHIRDMNEKAAWLNSQRFVRLQYDSANGTDFTVDLIPGAKWSGAGELNQQNKVFFVPNMPTEEVFTSPMRGKCSGRLVATKPLSYGGQLITGFSIDFRDGRVSDCHADEGEDTLRKIFEMDEGASMLGEVALVPKESPINRSGLLFYNGRYDENACCHVALGKGFSEVLDGFMSMSDEEIRSKGINDSLIHVDFMVGSDDLHITGIREDGSKADIFTDGSWAKG